MSVPSLLKQTLITWHMTIIINIIISYLFNLSFWWHLQCHLLVQETMKILILHYSFFTFAICVICPLAVALYIWNCCNNLLGKNPVVCVYSLGPEQSSLHILLSASVPTECTEAIHSCIGFPCKSLDLPIVSLYLKCNCPWSILGTFSG